MEIKLNKYYSYSLKELPKGCQYCVKGKKLVIFITGLCPRNCYFCPLSELKYQKDVIFANERPVNGFGDIEQEANLMQAEGASFTGGDPLTKIDRTTDYIKQLKQKFGKRFHIHLYTSLNLVNPENLKQLAESGLDEIRFHLDLDNQKLWPNLNLAKDYPWEIGVEIPIIPGKEKELTELIDFIQDKVGFLNLNELELSDSPVSKLNQLGFQPINQLSYAVKESLELGLKLLKYVSEKNYPLKVHLCTVKLKDAVQLTERIKREAQKAKLPFDLVDKEGLLTRGALYLPELTPSYQEQLKKANAPILLDKLFQIQQKIKSKLNLEQVYIDKNKYRLLLSKSNIIKNKKYFKSLNLNPAIVTEYPTYDQLEVEIDFL